MVEGTDYTVTYQSNKNIGKSYATIKGMGNYTGSKKISFYIVPEKTTIEKLSSPAAKKAVISWEKANSTINGYEVTYSTNKNFSKSITKKTSKTSLKLASLKSKKTYYVKVRAYKKADGKTLYGEYSKNMKVSVK